MMQVRLTTCLEVRRTSGRVKETIQRFGCFLHFMKVLETVRERWLLLGEVLLLLLSFGLLYIGTSEEKVTMYQLAALRVIVRSLIFRSRPTDGRKSLLELDASSVSAASPSPSVALALVAPGSMARA